MDIDRNNVKIRIETSLFQGTDYVSTGEILFDGKLREATSDEIAHLALKVRELIGEEWNNQPLAILLNSRILPPATVVEMLREAYREVKLLESLRKISINTQRKSLEERTDPREKRIVAISSRVHSFLRTLMPGWFLETFDESLIDDLFSFAKEEGGRIWWLRLVIAASGFVVKFAWRRLERRRSVEKSGRLPADRDDEP